MARGEKQQQVVAELERSGPSTATALARALNWERRVTHATLINLTKLNRVHVVPGSNEKAKRNARPGCQYAAGPKP